MVFMRFDQVGASRWPKAVRFIAQIIVHDDGFRSGESEQIKLDRIAAL
jgi:hypothetical protein